VAIKSTSPFQVAVDQFIELRLTYNVTLPAVATYL
jgi:hypothetical protein